MSQLNELINKTIHDIQFNGCTLPESILRHQIENIVACAQLEESMQANQRFLDSIGTAFGNGANDRPNVIGDMITEPSLRPEDMVKGEWYVTNGDNWGMWLLKFNYYSSDKRICTLNSYCVDSKIYYEEGCWGKIMTDTIRPATKEEVLIYFPDETFTEPADYVNPITN